MLVTLPRFALPLVLTTATLLSACGGGGSSQPKPTPVPPPTPTTAVTVVLAGNSMGTVSSSPSGIDCSTAANADCNETYNQSGMVVLTAAPVNANNVFVSWSGDAAGCGTSPRCSLMLTSSSINAVATFQPVSHKVSVSKTGSGTVSSDPAGIDCGSACTASFQQGTTVTLTATPANGFSFQGWSGDCSGTGTCTGTLLSSRNVTATFISNTLKLTVNKLGNGSVTSSPAGIDCGAKCDFDFRRGTSVTLTATAGANDVFQGWSGGGCSGTGSCTTTLNDNVTVTASFSGASGQSAGDLIGLTDGNRIVSFNRTSPGTFRTSAVITGLPGGETVRAIDTRPLDGLIYGLTTSSRLVTINLTSGAATVKSTLKPDSADTTQPFNGLSGSSFGIDFNPKADLLRIISSSGQNLKVNVDTGAVTTDADLNPAGAVIVDPAYTFNYAGSTSPGLFVINSASDKLQIQTVSPGQVDDGKLVDVGPLGIDVTALGGFEIIGTNIDAFAALNVSGGPATGSLYSIDVRSGTATKVGDFAGNEKIISLAAPIAAAPPAPGDLALLTTGGKLVTVNRSAPGTQRTGVLITGLTAGDKPLDIDYRNDTTGALYLLARDSGSGASLYTVDAATGAAGGRVALSADSADTTSPYSGLTGNTFGIDFNPAADRLRIVSDSGQNLAVSPADGKVTTDASISNGNTLLAAAYTNGFPQAASTTLYTINSNGGTLNQQLTPSDGVQSRVGSLGFTTVSGPVGFDIDGRNNEGLLSATDGSTPKLYSVNLATGSATGTAGQALASGEPVLGLSLKPQKEPEIFAVSTAGNLLRFTSTTSADYKVVAAITGLPSGVTVLGMDFRPRTGQLVALGSNAKLYTIAIGATTAVASELSTLSDGSSRIVGTSSYAVNFDPVSDRLRIVGSNNLNLRVNVDSGDTVADADVARPPVAITGNAYTSANPAVLYGIDSSSMRLFRIDTGTTTGTGTTGGRLTQVGPLGVNVSAMNGFDIVGRNGSAYFAGKDPSNNVAKLYNVVLATGQTSVAGVIGNSSSVPTGSEVLAMSSRTQTDDLYAVISGGDFGQLVSFLPGSPSSLRTNFPLFNIGANETVVGMDFAAITSGTGTTATSDVLYLLTKTSAGNAKLYTVDLTSGQATAVAREATCTGSTPAALALSGTAFDLEYTPNSQTNGLQATKGTVRINSDGGLNATIDLSCLTTTPLNVLTQPAPVITAAAYTNSYAGAAVSTLYDLDTMNDSLMTQSENASTIGQLLDVRAVDAINTGSSTAASANITSVGSLDVLGGENGYAAGVLQLNGNNYSTLYRVDLSGKGTVLRSLGDVGKPASGSVASTLVLINAAATRFTP